MESHVVMNVAFPITVYIVSLNVIAVQFSVIVSQGVYIKVRVSYAN